MPIMSTLSTLKESISRNKLALFSGLLIGTSFIPFPPWASLFGFVPLWLFWSKETSYKRIFFAGWITQFLLTLIGFNWIAHDIQEFGELPWAIAILGMLAYCCFANLYIPIAGVIWSFLNRRMRWAPSLSILALSLVTALSEIYLQTIFPWNFGYTFLWIKAPLFQLAEMIGFQGISGLVILANAYLYLAWTKRAQFSLQKSLSLFLGVFLALNALGWFIGSRVPAGTETANILVVQANIPNQQKIYAERGWGFRDFILNKFLRLTHKGTQEHANVDFAIWPETAFPDYMNDAQTDNVRKLLDYVDDNHLHLITGGYTNFVDDSSANSMYFLTPGERASIKRYDKSELLAFGEYIPGAERFPVLKKWLPMVADFRRGGGPSLVEFKGFRIGPQICYEALYPYFSKSLADQGAEIIVNITNDSWFGWWFEPYQHATMTLARAIEFRRPLVRSTNTGISVAITAAGQKLQASPIGSEWVSLFSVPYLKNPGSTIYQNFFYAVPLLLFLALIVLLIRGRITKP